MIVRYIAATYRCTLLGTPPHRARDRPVTVSLMNGLKVLLVYCTLSSFVAAAPSLIQSEPCKEISLGKSALRALTDIPSVAGSYIPGDLYWARPQHSIAPCFRVDRKLHFGLGCHAKIHMYLDGQCAKDFYNRYGTLPGFYTMQVRRGCIRQSDCP